MQFVAKQMLGSQLKELQGATGTSGDKDPEAEAKAKEQEELVRQAREEAEQDRKEKHMKFEDEREKMRQGIREKYNIKKKEEPPPEEAPVVAMPGMEGRLTRAKGTGPPGRATVPTMGGAAGAGGDADDDNPMVMAQAAISAAKDSVSGFFSRFGGGK